MSRVYWDVKLMLVTVVITARDARAWGSFPTLTTNIVQCLLQSRGVVANAKPRLMKSIVPVSQPSEMM